MNKISKKIVSLVTMAAFALTLVPAAAFAATDDKTGYTVSEATATDYNKTTVNITLSDSDLNETVANGGNIIVWAEDTNGNLAGTPSGQNSTYQGMAVVNVTGGTNAYNSLSYTFTAAGDYRIYVALNDDNTDWITSVAEAKDAALQADGVAFHAYGEADRAHSSYGVIKNGAVEATATATTDKDFETGFVIKDDGDAGTPDKIDQKVVVWAVEEGQTQPTSFVKFNGTTVTTAQNGFAFASGVDETSTVDVAFTKAGTYTLYAGVGNNVEQAKMKQFQGKTVVTVSDANAAIDSMTVEATTTNEKTPVKISFDSNNFGRLDLTALDKDFDYDGIDKVTLTGTVVDENNKPIQGKTITMTTNKDSVIELDNNAVSDVTDQYGKFSLSFDMQYQSNATLYLTNEDDNIEYTISVIASTNAAENIDRTKTGGYVLAGNDNKYGDTVYAGKTPYLSDAVQFAVTDKKGNAVTGDDAIAGAKIEIRDKADDSTLTNDSTVNGAANNDLKFAWDADNNVYTLQYVGGNSTGNYAKDLIPGEYEVRVSLASGDNATVTFTVAKFGKVQDTVLDIHATDYDWENPANPNAKTIVVDDQITLGQSVNVDAMYVDGNGIKVPAAGVNFGYNGKAVRDFDPKEGTFYTPADSAVNDSLIGTEIEVIAYNTANKQLVTKTLTVVDSYTDKSLEFGSDQGPAAQDNKVAVSVVNADGKVQQVKGSISAWVADQSNEDAKVSVDTTGATVTNGKGSFTVYSDEETTADIVVVVQAGTEAYAATLHYTFGSEDPLAGRTVVMTVGATEYVVNNNVITGDAAPFVDSNWRTMVPLRALAESFDAEVIWDDTDRTVTINYDGDTTIVMTVGDADYTVDGADKTMDTEPVIQGDRTYVPIRFAAEALGFSVTPLYDNAGLTASVVFQR